MDKHFNVLILASPIPTARFAGIARCARENGWYLTIEDRRYPPVDWQGDGVLVMLPEGDDALADAVARYRRRKIPVVDMKLSRPDIDLPRVTADNAAIGTLAAGHFADRAFTNLAWYSSRWSPVQETRYEAFAKGSRRAAPDKWVWSETGKAGGGMGDGRLRWLEARLKKAPKPLGVFCHGDYDATCVLSACISAGLSVPNDVAILGVGDNEIGCENQPVPLSSIRLDYGRIGYEAAALLQKLMKGGKAPASPRLIPPTCVTQRRSTDTLATQDPVLREALALIADNFTKPMSAAKIAKKLKVARVKLDKVFADELGRSPGAEVLRRRLDKARYLLTETDTKVVDVAPLTGFCNAPYLIRTFKKAYGVSPAIWRRREAATRKSRAGF